MVECILFPPTMWLNFKDGVITMSIIKSHDVTLYCGNDEDIVLLPLSDEHLPYLYKWCADSSLRYWTEGGTDNQNLSYGTDTVNAIYGGV